MAVSTEFVTLTGAWSPVSTGSLDVMIQLRSPGVIEIIVAETSPAVVAAIQGIVLDTSGDTVFSITGLAATDNVYARVPSGDNEQITVMKAPQPA
jgi:hypothetical protein